MRAFNFAARELWAIFSQVGADGIVIAPQLKQIMDIALRVHEPDFEAVAQKLADRKDDAGILEMRGPVAVLNVIGPIFRYADFFTQISGAATVDDIATAFRAAMADPAAKAIVLNFDTPGGMAAGIDELAGAIYNARGQKPIVSYADDLTASAGYWLATAADRIVTSQTAELGSIGVVATVVTRAEREGVKSYEFVSSTSPKKRPNLETDDGRAILQQRIDDLAGVFVATVARNRGVPEAKVLADFGQGGVMIASKAIAAGMADETGNFEDLVADLSRPGSLITFGGTAAKSNAAQGANVNKPDAADPKPAENTHTAADVAAAKAAGVTEGTAEGIKQAKARIGVILSCEEAKGRETLARMIAIETDTDPEAAKKLLAAAPVQAAPKPNALAEAMGRVPNPNVGSGAADANDEQAEVAAILAAAKAARGGK